MLTLRVINIYDNKGQFVTMACMSKENQIESIQQNRPLSYLFGLTNIAFTIFFPLSGLALSLMRSFNRIREKLFHPRLCPARLYFHLLFRKTCGGKKSSCGKNPAGRQ